MFPRLQPKVWWLVGLVALGLCAACAGRPPAPDLGVDVPAGYKVERFANGLEGPTQMVLGPDGRIWLAQLAGPESAGMGQIVALDRHNPEEREILLEDLFKPTGLAVLPDAVWIAAGRDLLRAARGSDGQPGPPAIVFEDLPYNGRSNGTLSLTPGGRLIYETSGSRRGNSAAEGSASLWSLDPAEPAEPELIATGLKNAYAHTFDEGGRLWATDVADDPVNGGPPPDELNQIRPGADYGWPACFGEQEPATNYGGTEAACQRTVPAVAVFPPRSTPTSVVPSPWEQDVLLVALWGPADPAVVRVQLAKEGDRLIAEEVSPFVTRLAHPQSLLTLPDGSLLVSDYDSGEIFRVTRP